MNITYDILVGFRHGTGCDISQKTEHKLATDIIKKEDAKEKAVQI